MRGGAREGRRDHEDEVSKIKKERGAMRRRANSSRSEAGVGIASMYGVKYSQKYGVWSTRLYQPWESEVKSKGLKQRDPVSGTRYNRTIQHDPAMLRREWRSYCNSNTHI